MEVKGCHAPRLYVQRYSIIDSSRRSVNCGCWRRSAGSGVGNNRLNIFNLGAVWKPVAVCVERLESNVAADAEGLHVDCEVLTSLSASCSTPITLLENGYIIE